MSRIVPLLLALGALAAAAALLRAGLEIPAIPAPPPPRGETPITATPPAPRLAPLPAYAAVTERPLFLADRAPQPPAAPSADAPRGMVFGLSGTIASGARRFALLRRPDGKIDRLTEGQSVEGWRIVRIQSDRVTLESTQGTIEVRFASGPPGRE